MNPNTPININPRADSPDSKRTPPTPGAGFNKVFAKERREEKDSKKRNAGENFDNAMNVKGEEKTDTEYTTDEKNNVSLFELVTEEAVLENKSKTQTAAVEKEELVELPKEFKEVPLSMIFNHLSKSLKSNQANPHAEAKGADLEDFVTEEEGVHEKSQVPQQFVKEQPDLATVNPMASSYSPGSSALSANSGSLESTGSVSRSTELKEIIDQIVDKIYTIKVEGQTDTVITLKTPLFSGANVVLSSFDTAQKEFNISFTNLTQQAREIILANQARLKLGLEEKGMTVHIITASTYTEVPQIRTADAQNQGQGERDQSAEDQRRRKREQEEEKF